MNKLRMTPIGAYGEGTITRVQQEVDALSRQLAANHANLTGVEVREDLHCCLCPKVEYGITYGEAMILGWEATSEGREEWICPAHN